MKTLIVYKSKHGAVKEVAEYIGGRLDFHKLGFLEKKIICMVNRQEHLYEEQSVSVVDQLHWENIDAAVEQLSHA